MAIPLLPIIGEKLKDTKEKIGKFVSSKFKIEDTTDELTPSQTILQTIGGAINPPALFLRKAIDLRLETANKLNQQAEELRKKAEKEIDINKKNQLYRQAINLSQQASEISKEVRKTATRVPGAVELGTQIAGSVLAPGIGKAVSGPTASLISQQITKPFVEGVEEQRTRDILESYAKKYPEAKVSPNIPLSEQRKAYEDYIRTLSQQKYKPTMPAGYEEPTSFMGQTIEGIKSFWYSGIKPNLTAFAKSLAERLGEPDLAVSLDKKLKEYEQYYLSRQDLTSPDWAKEFEKNPLQATKMFIGRMFGEAVSYMAPMVALPLITKRYDYWTTVAPMQIMETGSFINNLDDVTKNKDLAYSLASLYGGISAIIENASGYTIKGVSQWLSNPIQRTAQKSFINAVKSLGKIGLNTLWKAIQEGNEELAQAGIELITRRWLNQPPVEDILSYLAMQWIGGSAAALPMGISNIPSQFSVGLTTEEISGKETEKVKHSLQVDALQEGLDFWAYKLMGSNVEKPFTYDDINKTIAILEKGQLPKGDNAKGLKKEDIPLYLEKMNQIKERFLEIFPEEEKLAEEEKPTEVKQEIKPISEEIESIIKEFEKETGYNAKPFSSKEFYKSGAILKNNKIVEIGDDDHSILSDLPEKLTYRFTDNGELYFRIPQTFSKTQLENAIKISPFNFKYVAVDILNKQNKVVNSFDKNFVVGNKIQLKKFFDQVVEGIKEVKPIEKTKPVSEEFEPLKEETTEVKEELPKEKITEKELSEEELSDEELDKFSEEELKKIYYKEYQDIKKDYEKKLFDDIKLLGGLKIDPSIAEEMSETPIDILRKNGQYPDELAAELNNIGYNFENGMDLVENILNIRKMPSRYKPAKTNIEKRIKELSSIKVKMPKKVSESKRIKNLEKMARKLIKEATVKQRIIPPKEMIRKTTGLSPSEKIEITEREILRLSLRGQEKAARVAFREGQKQGIFKTKEKYEEVIERAKTKQEIKNIGMKLRSINTKNLPLEYKEQIRDILDNFDLKYRSKKTLDERKALRDYVNKLRLEGIEVNVPEEIINAAEKIPLNDLTIDQARMLYQQVKALVKLGTLKNKLIRVQAGRYIENTVEELSNYLLKGKPIKKVEIITEASLQKGFWQQELDDISGVTLRVARMQRIIEDIDQYKEDGLMKKIYSIPYEEAKDQKITGTLKTQDEFKKLTEDNKIKLKKFLTKKIEIAPKVFITPSERIGIYLHTKNPDNLLHLKYGNFGEYLKNHGEEKTDELINKIVKSITPQELKIAEYLQSYFEKEGPELSKVRTRVEGKSLDIIEHYFPIRLEWRADPEINFQKQLETEDSLRFIAKWASSNIAKSFLKERSHKASQPIKLGAIEIFWDYVEKAEHYKAFAPLVRDLQLITYKSKGAIKAKIGDHGYSVLDKWLKTVADSNPMRVTNHAEATMRSLRVNGMAVYVGFKIVTALKQFPSFFNAMAETVGKEGELSVVKGLFTYITHPKQVEKEIKEYAPQVYKRTFERELAEARLMKGLDKRISEKLTPREVAMIFSSLVDKFTVNSIWKGIFDANLAKTGDIKKSAARATEVIQKTQGWAIPADMPEYYRSGEMMKALLIFTNELNQFWNYARYDLYGKYKAGQIKFSEVVRKVFWGYIVSALLIGWISRSRPAKDAKEFVSDIANYSLSMLPIVGNYIVSGMEGFRDQSVVSTELLQALGNTAYYLGKKEWDKALKTMPELISLKVGFPYQAVKNFLDGMIDISEGKTNDLWRLIYSEYTREKANKELIEKRKAYLESIGIKPTKEKSKEEMKKEYLKSIGIKTK